MLSWYVAKLQSAATSKTGEAKMKLPTKEISL